MEKTDKRIKELEELLKDFGFDVAYSAENADDADDFIEQLNQQIEEEEVIYYSNAIKYLQENDPSLCDSMAIAQEMGYSPKDLNSELLATMLKQQNDKEELSKLEDEIREIWNNEESEA